jgi:hypothetical protein
MQSLTESELPDAYKAAGKKRRKLAQLEQAQFGGTSGAAQGALARERAGQY